MTRETHDDRRRRWAELAAKPREHHVKRCEGCGRTLSRDTTDRLCEYCKPSSADLRTPKSEVVREEGKPT